MQKTTFALVGLFLFALVCGAVTAQTRVSDKDIESMMKNLNEDAKLFAASFNSGISKTSIRKTSREKESKVLVKRFTEQTEGMLKNFKKTKKADEEMRLVRISADKINQLLEEIKLDAKTVSGWGKIQDELSLVSRGLGISE